MQNTKDRISYLRALAIGNLINEAAHIFIQNESAILNGEFIHSLLDKCKYEAQIHDIINLSVEKIYQSNDVVEKEIAGYTIIADLLEVFISAVNNSYENRASNYDKLIMLLIPETYRELNSDLYQRVLNICNLIANFSDRNAILLHKKIKGIDLN